MARIIINKEWCKKCGICSSFCPKQVFNCDKDGYPAPIHSDLCVNCQLCVLHCPDFAIRMEV